MPHEPIPNRTVTPLAVSPAEAARLAGIGRTKLYSLMASGELSSFKIGTRRLIRVSVLDAWLASHEDASNTPAPE